MSSVEDNATSQPRRRGRRKAGDRLLWLVFSIGLLGLAGVGIYRARLIALSSLMDNATWVAPFDKYNTYRWVSNHEVMLYQYRQDGLASFRWDTHSRQSILIEKKPIPKNNMNLDKFPRTMSGRRANGMRVVQAWIASPSIAKNLTLPPPDYIWKFANTENVAIDYESCVTSPDGKRIAYSASMQRPNLLAQLLARFHFLHLPKPKTGVGIMVNDADGKNARLLGFTEVDMPEQYGKFSKSGKTASLQRLQWRPGGKELSFAYGDGIYTLPVN